MNKLVVVLLLAFSLSSASEEAMIRNDFSGSEGMKTVRSRTQGHDTTPSLLGRHRPIRNPSIMAQVLWVDRAHEFAIAENVTTTPDGSAIFAGWWLNNMRYSSYASAGLEFPVWRYNVSTPWMMPVAASDFDYAGTGANLPAFIWNNESPLPREHYEFEPGYSGGGLSFSGNGNLVAIVSAFAQTDAILVIYDMIAQDTIYTRHFEPVSGLYGVDLSLDGAVAVVSCYSALYVFEVPSGNSRGTLSNFSQGTAKTSADGTLIANGTYTGGVYLYEWNGSEYDTRWIRSTQDDWVTAIDISDDGSTVACGTLDFDGSQVAGGKFKMWDADSGTVLIDYDEYGDMVASVALSATGRYAIAGSWGQYGMTFGDVVSVFIRDSQLPIFQLADDLDESGSVFGVAISDSGRYAAAGGKAVHAREFGNGGMLYSIQIRDPLTNDVAVASIDEPGEFLAPGESAFPTATYINVGTQQASFATACTVVDLSNDQVIYSNSFDISNLPSFGTGQVFYPQWTMPGDGRYRLFFSASLSNDEDLSNNTLALIVRSWHDLVGVSVQSPFDEVTLNWSMIPTVTFRNLGSYYETFDISLSIEDSSGAEVFSAASSVFDLAPYGEEQVSFDGWVPSANGLYRAIFTAEAPEDLTPENNVISKEFRVVNEMIYDDGTAEAAFWVDAYPNSSNRMFAQRFEPNIVPPATITNIRFFQPNITYTGYFDYIHVTSELDGFPDTLNTFAVIDEPQLPGPNNWASFDLQAPIFLGDPLWMVIHWADVVDPGPYIGADNTGILDRQSYWYANEYGWNQYLFYDWMIRMTLMQGVGVESDFYSGLPDKITLGQNYPNPFNPSTKIRFGMPNAGWAKIEIFDMLGRKVRTLADKVFDAGFYTVTWDGRADNGEEISSGAYLYRLETNEARVTRKMLMLR
jgi:WD40 repeat protein